MPGPCAELSRHLVDHLPTSLHPRLELAAPDPRKLTATMARELKLGLSTGYWAGGPPAEASRRSPRPSGWGSTRSGPPRPTARMCWRRWRGGAPDQHAAARHGDRADERAPARRRGDGRDDARPPLSGGRFILGLGRPGRRLSRAGTGCRSPSRSRARASTSTSCARSGPARGRSSSKGQHYALRCARPGDTGLGKPLKSSIHPLREDIPIFLAAEGPKNVAMAAEIGDGWLALFFSPHAEDFYRRGSTRASAPRRAPRSFDDFEVAAIRPAYRHRRRRRRRRHAPPLLRPLLRRHGSEGRETSTPTSRSAWATRTRWAIQDLYLEGKKDEAAGAIPTRAHRAVALIGPADKIRHDLEAVAESFATTLLVGGDPAMLRQAAEIVIG